MHTEQLTAGRFRAYSPDAVPLWALSSKRAVAHIGKTFGFEHFQLVQSEEKQLPPSLFFARGRAPATDPAEPAMIESLRISHDHLDLTTHADDGHAFNDTLLVELGRVCAEVTPERVGWIDKFHVEVCQTVWIGRLAITPEDLIDPRVRAVLLPALTTREDGSGTRNVYPRGLSLRLAALTPKPELLELGLQLADEEFKLEPRAGRPASERAWFSASPLRSENHLKLLGEIERVYAVNSRST